MKNKTYLLKRSLVVAMIAGILLTTGVGMMPKETSADPLILDVEIQPDHATLTEVDEYYDYNVNITNNGDEDMEVTLFEYCQADVSLINMYWESTWHNTSSSAETKEYLWTTITVPANDYVNLTTDYNIVLRHTVTDENASPSCWLTVMANATYQGAPVEDADTVTSYYSGG